MSMNGCSRQGTQEGYESAEVLMARGRALRNEMFYDMLTQAASLAKQSFKKLHSLWLVSSGFFSSTHRRT